MPAGAIEGKFRGLRPRTPMWLRRRGFSLHFSKGLFPHPLPRSALQIVQEGVHSLWALPLKSPCPFSHLFFFFLFGCENNSGYQTASGFGPWNAFVLQKAKKLPRITKRQVRTIAFRKQPYYSVLSGLWRRQKGRRGIIESVALNTARLCMTHLTAIFNTFVWCC